MNIKHIGDCTNATKLIIKYSKCCSSRNRVLFFFLLEGQMNHRSNGFIVCGLNFWSQIRYHWDQKKLCAHLWENKTSERFFKKRYLQSLFALQYIIGWFLIFNIYLFIYLKLQHFHKNSGQQRGVWFYSSYASFLQIVKVWFCFPYVPRHFWLHLEPDIKAEQSHKQASISFLNWTRKHWKAYKGACRPRPASRAPQKFITSTYF